MNEKRIIDSFYEHGIFLDFYQILEVNQNASSEEIKKNYYRLSKMYHPDSIHGNVEKMQQLGTAYRILKDEETRKLYDSYYLNQGKKETTKQAESFYNYHAPRSTFSSINRSSASFSWDYIREILRKCHYSDIKIDGFIAWCQRNSVSISNGSELASKFREYNSLNHEANQMKRTSYEYPQEERRFVDFRNLEYSSIHSMFYRQMMVRQMVMSSLFSQYLENPLFSYPHVSNFHLYRTPSVRMVLYPYVPTTRVVFYSRPKVKYYF